MKTYLIKEDITIPKSGNKVLLFKGEIVINSLTHYRTKVLATPTQKTRHLGCRVELDNYIEAQKLYMDEIKVSNLLKNHLIKSLKSEYHRNKRDEQ
jgi:hypothetical protein